MLFISRWRLFSRPLVITPYHYHPLQTVHLSFSRSLPSPRLYCCITQIYGTPITLRPRRRGTWIQLDVYSCPVTHRRVDAHN